MTQNTGVLYMATAPSGRRYIGITTQGVTKRWRDHCHAAAAGRHTHLTCAIRKHGGESFDIRTLAMASWEELNRLEPLAIVAYETRSPKGYNLREGGSQSSPHAETIEKLRLSHLGNTHSDETKAKMSAAHKGRRYHDGMLGKKHSEETKEKMRQAALRRPPMSEEIRRKIGESQKRRHALRKSQ